MGFVSVKRGVSPTEMKTGGPVLPLCLDADVIAKTVCGVVPVRSTGSQRMLPGQ